MSLGGRPDRSRSALGCWRRRKRCWRSRRVWLAVLADRGGRELPISPDHVGFVLSRDMPGGLADGEWVDVHLQPMDAEDAIVVRSIEDRPPAQRAQQGETCG